MRAQRDRFSCLSRDVSLDLRLSTKDPLFPLPSSPRPLRVARGARARGARGTRGGGIPPLELFFPNPKQAPTHAHRKLEPPAPAPLERPGCDP